LCDKKTEHRKTIPKLKVGFFQIACWYQLFFRCRRKSIKREERNRQERGGKNRACELVTILGALGVYPTGGLGAGVGVAAGVGVTLVPGRTRAHLGLKDKDSQVFIYKKKLTRTKFVSVPIEILLMRLFMRKCDK